MCTEKNFIWRNDHHTEELQFLNMNNKFLRQGMRWRIELKFKIKMPAAQFPPVKTRPDSWLLLPSRAPGLPLCFPCIFTLSLCSCLSVFKFLFFFWEYCYTVVSPLKHFILISYQKTLMASKNLKIVSYASNHINEQEWKQDVIFYSVR